MKYKSLLVLSLVSLISLAGCNKNKQQEEPQPSGDGGDSGEVTPGTIDDVNPKDGDHYGGVEQSGTVGLTYTVTKYKGDDSEYHNGYKVTGYVGSSAKVVIPATFNGEAVVEIGARAFENNLVMESITLGRNVRAIGEFAFSRTYNMTKVELDKDNHFFTLDEGIVYKVENEKKTLCFGEAGRYLSYDATANNVSALALGCFGNFEKMMYLKISLDMLPKIGTDDQRLSCIFNYNKAANKYFIDKMKNAFIPHLSTLVLTGSSVNTIPDYFAEYCYSLTSLVIDEGIVDSGVYSFQHCLRLRNVELPASMQFVRPYAFAYCTDLYRVYVPVPASDTMTWMSYSSTYGVFFDPDRNTNGRPLTMVFAGASGKYTIQTRATHYDGTSGSLSAEKKWNGTYEDYLNLVSRFESSPYPADPE